jgi:hypothetical protein
MRLYRHHIIKILIVQLLILNGKFLFAQDAYTRKQVWPQLDFYYRLNNQFRLYGMYSSTRSNSEYTDGTSGIYVDYFALPWVKRGRDVTEMSDSARGYYLWFRTGYSYSDAPPNQKKKYVNIYEMESNSSFNLPGKVLLIWRNRIDWRWVNDVYQPIYRLRLKFVRNFKTDYLTFNMYTYGEYYYYWTDNNQDRIRWCLGTVIKATKFLTFEVYYLYQWPNNNYVPSVNAIGLQLNFYFASKHYKN